MLAAFVAGGCVGVLLVAIVGLKVCEPTWHCAVSGPVPKAFALSSATNPRSTKRRPCEDLDMMTLLPTIIAFAPSLQLIIHCARSVSAQRCARVNSR
jgi:hypothetical protein